MSYILATNKEHVYAMAYVLLTRTHTRFADAHIFMEFALAYAHQSFLTPHPYKGPLPEHEYKGLERGLINDRYIMIYPPMD